jgi:hypothetical protein
MANEEMGLEAVLRRLIREEIQAALGHLNGRDRLLTAEKKVAAERARERIESEVDTVMDEYLRLATGGKIKKGSSPQMIRHCVERWLPPARHAIDISVDSPEEFYRALEAARRREAETQTPTIDVPRA